MTSLDLWPIGNCQVSALVDTGGRFVWGCVPRVDGDPIFSSLIGGGQPEAGYWSIALEGVTSVRQHYLPNTPILVTRQEDAAGNAIEVIDFCPRFERPGRTERPMAFARIVRPIAGHPRIRVTLRPTAGWGRPARREGGGADHQRYVIGDLTLRLTTSAPAAIIAEEGVFAVGAPLHFLLGADEDVSHDLAAYLERMLADTIQEWRRWCRGLATPAEWQDVVIRSAITLKLCQHEETGAIVAALTTSIPEHAGSQRNWDYRYCWIRDAYYSVQALTRLGALDVIEGYLGYLRGIIASAADGPIQPLYSVVGEAALEERIAPDLAGYRGMGPVRVGNQAYRQVQHDAYGQIVLSSMPAFADRRLYDMAGIDDFTALERIGELAWRFHDTPDAGLWELRTRQSVHTYSAAMCWAACDRLAEAAAALALDDRRLFWADRATHIRDRIIAAAWRPKTDRLSATFAGDDLDASLIQLLDLRFFAPDDPCFLGTLRAVEAGLRRGDHMLRYASEDDFGLPVTAFTVCTFWLIEALHLTGRTGEARALFEAMLGRRTGAGLLSEDIDPVTGELWGNYPQTYSLVGLIDCAVLLSRR